jgi:hypothetical protein
MDSLVERIPGVLDTINWPTPFASEETGWLEGDGILVAYDRSTPVLEDPDHRYELPVRFEALVDRPGLPRCQLRIAVKPTGPVCLRLTLVPREGEPPLTTSGTRVPLRELVKEIVLLLGSFNRQTMRLERESFERVLANTFSRPEPGRKIPDVHFERVADVYRYAIQRGLPPTEAVAEAFDVSRSTGGRWVVETRRRGLLGAAVPGKAGEIQQEESHG